MTLRPNLHSIALVTPTDSVFLVGDGTNWVGESDSTARTSLGLGTIATQAANSVNIDGGAIDGTTIGASSAAAGTFTYLGVNTAAGTRPLTTKQLVDGQGWLVENVSGSKYCSMAFTSDSLYVVCTGALYFYTPAFLQFYTSTSGVVEFQFDTHTWKDAAGTVRMTLAGATGNLAIGGTATAGGSRLVEATIETALPTYLYAVEGQECNVYFDNICLTSPRGSWEWNVACALGTQYENRWSFTAVAGDAGTAAWSITPKVGKYEATAESATLRVTALAGASVSRSILMVGDSTGSGALPELVNLLDGGNITATFVGTTETSALDSEGGSRTVKEEAYGGYTWAVFNGENQGVSPSPFWDGGEIDFGWYLTTNSISMTSGDWVLIHLGINDIFWCETDAEVLVVLNGLAAKIDTIVGTGASPAATTMRGAVSGIRIGLCVTIPASDSQDAMGANYTSSRDLWRYKRNLKLLQQWYIDTYDTATYIARNIHIVPLHANLDTVNNMESTMTAVNARNAEQYEMQSNGVHPIASGYYQMADSLYAFLKWFA